MGTVKNHLNQHIKVLCDGCNLLSSDRIALSRVKFYSLIWLSAEHAFAYQSIAHARKSGIQTTTMNWSIKYDFGQPKDTRELVERNHRPMVQFSNLSLHKNRVGVT